MEKVSIIGAGVMGMGIAQALAQQGFEVAVCDLERSIIERSLERTRKNLESLVNREKITAQEAEEIISRIKQTTNVEDISAADLIIEAASENMEVKKQVFVQLDGLCPATTILASNTSTLSPTEIASATKRPDKVIGMHWFNPAPVMRLIEVVVSAETSEETVQAVMEFSRRVGKTPVRVNEAPGGIVSRILRGYLNVAVDVLAEGVATVEDIDTAMKLGANFPMGPFELIDLIGVDIHTINSDALARELGDLKYRPHAFLRKMVRAGHLGRKTGRGFYNYTE
ncbi:MAG: 3-hydroxybutyryl-CoA dehydrogenase [Dehalococcoidia bacterium]|nr:MAG: 3-hydroxybutyryl-CoA dehydrogenase [Dehalococcoidia bacterium]